MPSEEGEDMDEDDNDDGDDEEKQIRILQETTGMPREAFDGKLFFYPVNIAYVIFSWTLHTDCYFFGLKAYEFSYLPKL